MCYIHAAVLTLVTKSVFFNVIEIIIIIQLTLKHVSKKNDFLYKKPPILQSEELYMEWKQDIEI